MMDYRINEERLSAVEYIDFLKTTDLGSQYPKERFRERIEKLVKTVSISLVARNANDKAISFYEKMGMKKSEEVMEYNHVEWTGFVVE